jgi:hypothetical protein
VRVHLNRRTKNEKTGPVAISTTERNSCPDSCPLRGAGCYAESGPLSWHWDKVSSGVRGYQWGEFLSELRTLPPGAKFRHNQAGDLPGSGDRVDIEKVDGLATAADHLSGWTYTHYPPAGNLRALRRLNASLTVNLSADTLAEADALAETGLPVVATVPTTTPERFITPDGRPGFVCPAQTRDITCADCMLCENRHPNRPIIGFRFHGASAARLDGRVG